ncbi:hypothetical protein ACPVTF_17915 [Geobacillus icigianus]|uniref:hypothetical protein n=1 Tax=Geobacillus TaxID=129337 RepID=UPI0012E0C142|nr:MULTISPECIES: hypothetical protein [Geobacillus]
MNSAVQTVPFDKIEKVQARMKSLFLAFSSLLRRMIKTAVFPMETTHILGVSFRD